MQSLLTPDSDQGSPSSASDTPPVALNASEEIPRLSHDSVEQFEQTGRKASVLEEPGNVLEEAKKVYNFRFTKEMWMQLLQRICFIFINSVILAGFIIGFRYTDLEPFVLGEQRTLHLV
jgi:hypothetical protein